MINRRLTAAFMAGALCLTSLCGASMAETAQAPADAQSTQESAESALETYEFPAMGMNVGVPQSLLDRVNQGEVTLLVDTFGTDDGSALQYGMLSWSTILESTQSNDGTEMNWILSSFGVHGVYQSEIVDQLDELTGCDTHVKLGESADGAYQYYLSTLSTADAELVAELRQTQVDITAMEPFQPSVSEEASDSVFTGASVGEFTTQDINGKTYTQAMFADYDLTLVNVFTTWCNPCVKEIPDLEKLHQAMADQGVNVVGVVLDVLDEKGEIQQDCLEKARQLAEETGATYPFLLPDSTYMNDCLTGISAFPHTFFVDKNGFIVGDTYSGSGSLEDWTEAVKKELANLKART